MIISKTVDMNFFVFAGVHLQESQGLQNCYTPVLKALGNFQWVTASSRRLTIMGRVYRCPLANERENRWIFFGAFFMSAFYLYSLDSWRLSWEVLGLAFLWLTLLWYTFFVCVCSNAIGLLMYRIDMTMLHRRENPSDRMTCRKMLQYEPNLRLKVCLVHIYLLVS